MDGTSLNIKDDLIKRLKEIIPTAFSDDKINVEQLKQILGEVVNTDTERYQLNWPGKNEAYKVLQTQTFSTLNPDNSRSINWETAKNTFIEGENLEVLKVLQKSYYGRVKLIYIDPPYNTGSDSFIYPDKFSESKEAYLKRLGDKNDDGILLKEDLFRPNRKENGQFHSNWLSMMLPRLFLARNLLRNEGMIFISIDDNEQANLKLLCDEVFGEENFVCNVIWQKAYSPINLKKTFSANHDFVLCYAKNINLLQMNGLQRSVEANDRYKNMDNDSRGSWKSSDLSVGPEIKEKVYPITTPSGRVVYPPKGYCWRLSKERFKEFVKDNRIWFGNNGDAVPSIKRFLSEVKDTITPLTLWLRNEVGDNQEAKQETKTIFDGESYFETPKPVRLMKRILDIGTNSTDEDIVLDFFAGSGTMAQAVIEKNYEDNGNRKFITVQMEEPCNPESSAFAYNLKYISDITLLRIKKTIENLNKSNSNAVLKNTALDTVGFRVFKQEASNFKIWRTDISNQAELLTQLDAFKETYRTTDVERIAWEYAIKVGRFDNATIKLSENFSVPVAIINDEVIVVTEKYVQELLNEIIEYKPKEVFMLDRIFNSKDNLKTNLVLKLNDAGIKSTFL
jgi:adenine-specific DNA-methyltransferase